MQDLAAAAPLRAETGTAITGKNERRRERDSERSKTAGTVQQWETQDE